MMDLLAAKSETSDLFIPTLIVLVVIAGLIGAIAVVRRKILAGSDDPENDPLAGLSLANLRDLVKQGKMTPEEFDLAKAQIVVRTQKAAEKAKPIDNPAPETKIDPEKLV